MYKYVITQSRLLYVYSIDDRRHQGLLKVGEVFVDNDVADNPDQHVLARAVCEILNHRPYMQGVNYNLVYVESTTYEGGTKCYKADDVYRTLFRMGIPSKSLTICNTKTGGRSVREQADIWFACFIEEIKEAVKKIKSGKGADYGTIKFRPEQDAAIRATVEHFSKPKGFAFLWNAKMRFGKTLSGLQVAKEMGYKSTLIITHRPVVDSGWNEDFNKIFRTNEALADYHSQGIEPAYGRRMMDDKDSTGDFYTLTADVKAGKKILVFFVSMQYLRLSKFVGGKEHKADPLKRAIMEYDWDFVMVDEAHEGIEAAAGVRVMNKLTKDNTRILSLSGTPFNLLDKYEEGEIYTWDYVMEQKAKQEWDDHHFGDPNPYADLPRMQILTFTLPKLIRDEAIENNEIFKFHEFFRVWTDEDTAAIQRLIEDETSPLKKAELQAKKAEIKVDKFIHEGAVRRFLDKLVEESDTSRYPFSTDEFRDKFRHTFWLLPGVKEAAALEELLREHEVFSEQFHIINAAGDGNIEDINGNALEEVIDNIRGYDPAKDSNKERAKKKKAVIAKEYTITLSCGKLTTGVTVPEWTAVLCMKGSENTPAASYMQTIFRVQTPAILNGRQKSDCYVFDFAPDRAITAVAETAKMAVYAQGEKGKRQLKLTQKKEEEHLDDFIRLCPVISMDEGEMGRHFTANQIFEKLSNVYIERAVRSGYADNSLYNPDQLMNLTPEQEKALGDVSDLLGSMPNSWKPEKITINSNGIGDVANAEQVKYIYLLTADSSIPQKPQMSAEKDEDGRPKTDDGDWSDVPCAPTELFPYLFVSNTRLIDGTWTSFSQPVLWKEWRNREADTDDARKQREKENNEKRARMSVLRGVSIRIPLLVYGAEINDESGEEITIDNFTDLVDEQSWVEYMPKGFAKETFNILKDCFDRSIFTGAAKRIRQMVKEADNLSTEDRIARIATIFSYFHNPDKETVLTPWRVVNMHMSDTVGGWCFWNEEFDALNTVENKYREIVNMPRFVDRGEVTKNTFTDYNTRILEINSKTGLYPLYMAYSVFKGAKEPGYRKFRLTGERGVSRDAEQYYHQAGNDLEIWKDVLQDNIFVVCRTKMAVSITKRTLAGFRKDIRMNIKCYEHKVAVNDLVAAGIIKANDEAVEKVGKTYYFKEQEELDCDMIDVLRAKPELFQNDIVRGRDFWKVYNNIPLGKNEDINNMKFSVVLGNPPYQLKQDDTSDTPIYHLFMDMGFKLSQLATFITPGRFLFKAGKTPKAWNDKILSDNHFKVIWYKEDSSDVFPNVDIKGGVAVTLRDSSKDYGKINIYTHYQELNTILGKVLNMGDFESINKIIYLQNKFNLTALYNDYPYYRKIIGSNGREKRLTTSIFEQIDIFSSERLKDEEIEVLGLIKNVRSIRYISSKYLEPHNNMNRYKVILPKVNGTGAYGETFSSPLIGNPGMGFTQSFISIGNFEHEYEANAAMKYLKTKFLRALLGILKVTQDNNSEVWEYVPLQDFSTSSDINWSLSVNEVDEQLYCKYDFTSEEKDFIERHVLAM